MCEALQDNVVYKWMCELYKNVEKFPYGKSIITTRKMGMGTVVQVDVCFKGTGR
jgi:hypothetical protein